MTADCLSFMSANGMSLMMLGAALFWLLLLALLILAAAALVKKLRANRSATAH